MLHIVFDDDTVDERLRPIPFPRERVTRRDVPGRRDSARMAEQAIERVQSKLDELDKLLCDPLPFPGRDDDDGPWAA
ncbi:MAG: hypothetical protein H6810_05010 [Phycisphaeraceae bacterium]|nr:MAG: hypothetical protein H6810_05010 [Phycisphaeraceae bacterium]